MSGGHWCYQNDRTAEEIFGLYPNYGERGFRLAKEARVRNPLEDKQLSELCWDLFCVLHSYDWYASADTGEETYRKDVDYFKRKWLKQTAEALGKREIDEAVEETRQELYKVLGVAENAAD